MDLRRPEAADVLDAHERLDGIAFRTPLLRSDELDARTGGRVFLKCENLQRTGAFKFHGAYNCLSRLDRQAYPGGVVAYSTGNHGQAVATVGRMLGIPATIVMPYDAPLRGPTVKPSGAMESWSSFPDKRRLRGVVGRAHFSGSLF